MGVGTKKEELLMIFIGTASIMCSMIVGTVVTIVKSFSSQEKEFNLTSMLRYDKIITE